MVVKVVKNKNFTIMSNHHLNNPNLSLKTIGLMSIVLSLPETWTYSIGGLMARTHESEASVKKMLNELKEQGYLVVRKMMPNETKTGRIEYEYTFYEVPNMAAEDQKQEVKNKGLISTPLNSTPLKHTPILSTKEAITKEQRTKDIKDIVMHLNEALETRYKPESKQLQEMINGRLSEGYTVEDFKKVINNMKTEWGEDEKMSRYLRPSTLFAPTHFPEYLNRKPKKQKPKVSYLWDDDEDDLGTF